jgi:hypothetical protein
LQLQMSQCARWLSNFPPWAAAAKNRPMKNIDVMESHRLQYPFILITK